MIKYYKELDDRENFYLPLVGEDIDKQCYINTPHIPRSFFEKYYEVFESMKNVRLYIEKVNYEIEKLGASERWDLGMVITSFSRATDIFLYSWNQEKDKRGIINYDISDTLGLLGKYNTLLKTGSFFFEDQAGYWRRISSLTSSAVKERRRYSEIIIPRTEKDLVKNAYLPDAWFITPYGTLYNTTGMSGHTESNLINPLENVTEMFLIGKQKTNQEESNRRKRRIRREYVTEGIYRNYLNYRYSCVTSDENGIFEKYSCRSEQRIYEPRIVTIVNGIIDAHWGFYSFFNRMYQEVENPKEEFRKLGDMTYNYSIPDILVSCAGFHKVEHSLPKTITTADITHLSDFLEYLKRGWDISIIPPIIINSEKKIIERLDLDSPIVARYLEEQLENYENHREKGYGDIYRKKDRNKVKTKLK